MERTKETLEARVRETPLVDRLKECQQRIGNMCAELRGPKMSIPVEYYDDDFNHACVNPHHLEAVTPLENWRRGIAPSAANANKTRCIRGHKFTPENTRIREDGRSCIACTKMRNAEATRKRLLDRLASEGAPYPIDLLPKFNDDGNHG